jgi:ATP-binding cassette, subfamily B, bacterial HlyB/CyaB
VIVVTSPSAETDGDTGRRGLYLISQREPSLFDMLSRSGDIAEALSAEDLRLRLPHSRVSAVIRFSKIEAHHVSDDSGTAPAKFGWKWFSPEILKHKKVWRDVLLASAAIQVMAIATPLCTQIIVDKVIVHQSQSTLYVIAAALALLCIGTAVLGWIRSYLAIHTGSRIDATLGSSVFSHTMRLPQRYFEDRQVGSIVTRLHGVDIIREFLTGTAITVLLDLPFAIALLALMFYYHWGLALVSLGFMLAIAVVGLLMSPSLRHRANEYFSAGARTTAFVTEHVRAVSTIKSIQTEAYASRQFDGLLAQQLRTGFSSRVLGTSYLRKQSFSMPPSMPM